MGAESMKVCENNQFVALAEGRTPSCKYMEITELDDQGEVN